MPPFLVAIFLFLAGLAIILYGYQIFMKFLPIWGFFTGFWLGADIMSQLFGQNFLGSTTGWVAGVILGGVFAGLSATYLKIGMAINAFTIGYAIGTGLVDAMGIDSQLITFAIGLVMAGLVLIFAVKNNLRVLALIIITTITGVQAFVVSLMLFFKAISLSDLQQSSVIELMSSNAYWPWIGLIATIIGIAFQYNANRSEFPWAKESPVPQGNGASDG